MFGKPKDVEGECNAHLYISDDYGDNEATIRCKLKAGHKGPHEERYKFRSENGKRKWNEVVIQWSLDCRTDR